VLDANCVSVANVQRILNRAAGHLMLLERIFSANPPETSNPLLVIRRIPIACFGGLVIYIVHDEPSCTMYISAYHQCISVGLRPF